MRPLWQFLNQLVAGQLARAEQVNDNLAEIQAALDEVGNELNRCIRLTYGSTPSEGAFQIAANPALNGGKLFALNATGTGVELVSRLLNPRGAWATATAYVVGDLIQSSPTGSLYYCAIAHTSGTFSTDLGAGRWILVLDATTAYQAARAFKIITAAMSPYTASPGDDLFVDVTSGPVTINLPSSPTISMQSISITHAGGDVVANPITVGRNGQPIMSLAEDMTVNTPNASLELGFMDGTRGWRLVRGV